MNSSSEEENYYKLDNILLSCSHNMPRVLRQRWKLETGKDWEEDTDIGEILAVTRRKWFRQAPEFQRSAMETTSIEEWDLALISLVIKNVGNSAKYEEENKAIEELKQIRNKLAHHSTKKIPKHEFDGNVEIIRNCLQIFGVWRDTIEKIISQAGITSSIQANELMKKIHEKADTWFADDQLDKAIEFYNKAVEVPSLLPENLGKAYEKRASCFLKMVKDPLLDGEKCSQALIDINKSLNLMDDSWTAHYIAAQCYRWKSDFPKALHHFHRSLAISPVQKQVKEDFESCKLLAGEYFGGGHFNPSSLYMNLEECLLDLEDQSGSKPTEEEFLYQREVRAEFKSKGEGIAFRGHKHFYGWNVPQNRKKAFEYYAESASMKNAEGMYNMARCYNFGFGVEQDFSKAFEILSELVKMNKKSPGSIITPYKCNNWIATGMHGLGIMYHDGTGVDKDFEIAEKWFIKAMENGTSGGAISLGRYYYEGKLVPQNRKMAELCWRQALNLKAAMVTSALIVYYIQELEPDKAIFMLKIGREMGNQYLQNPPDEYFNKLISEVRLAREPLEDQVLEFEMLHKLEIKGLTFSERMHRHLNPVASNYIKELKKFSGCYYGQPESWGGELQSENLNSKTIKQIIAASLHGSEQATRIVMTIKFGMKLQNLLEEYNSREQEIEIVNAYYKCAILEHYLIPITQASCDKLKKIVSNLYQEKGDVKGEADMKIRYCFGYLNLGTYAVSSDMYLAEVLKEGIERYPENSHYYSLLVNLYEGKRMSKEATDICDQGLRKFPSDINLLYFRACNFERDPTVKTNFTESIQAYQDFLHVAPKDHRKYPEAYYGICDIYLTQVQSQHDPYRGTNLDLVKMYFQKGLDAEKNQLPCFLPYGVSNTKRHVKTYLEAFESLPTKGPYATGYKHSSLLERKKYLKSPIRKGTFLVHRENLKTYYDDIKMNDASVFSISNEYSTQKPKLKPVMVKKTAPLIPITLIEINPNRDNLFENRVIDLTIVDDPNPDYSSIHMVTEDENGDIIQLFVYNVDRDKETMENFQAGCKIGVINPYLRIGAYDSTVGIRVDDPRCLVFLKKVENMCRFCGNGNAVQKCSRCKRSYCSRECQSLDWKLHGHKLICRLDSSL